MHFVIRWTMLRGVLAVPELLDDTGNALAWARKAQDDGAERDAAALCDRDGRMPRRERMRVTAADVAWAKKVLASAEVF